MLRVRRPGEFRRGGRVGQGERSGAVGRQQLDVAMFSESEVAAIGGEDAGITAVILLSVKDVIEG